MRRRVYAVRFKRSDNSLFTRHVEASCPDQAAVLARNGGGRIVGVRKVQRDEVIGTLKIAVSPPIPITVTKKIDVLEVQESTTLSEMIFGKNKRGERREINRRFDGESTGATTGNYGGKKAF